MEIATAKESDTALYRLEEKTGRRYENLAAARRCSAATLDRLGELLRGEAPSDTSVVVFGSLARGEHTRGSDVDWTLLVDGQADEGHHEAVRAITAILKRERFHEPGPTGVFGNFAFSHPILHQIGGQDDTNKLTTQRILLLLESRAVGHDGGNPQTPGHDGGDPQTPGSAGQEALERVLTLVLTRYVADDRGLLFGSRAEVVPRFLLNDIVRYWRTVTVDFVYKQRDRAEGWALRNTKLKMSRKLIFTAGLLACFAFEMGPGGGQAWRDREGKLSIPRLVRALRDHARTPPLEQLAGAALRPGVRAETALALFESYDAFVGVLGDEDKRLHLKRLTFEDLDRGDALFRETSRMARRFQEALHQLFFVEDEVLRRLTLDYGVF